jgi:opacity protein-like surface antigen
MSIVTKKLVAAAAVALVAGAGAASAQSFAQSQTYLKAFGGATWPSGDNENLRSNGSKVGRVDLDYDTGYTLGLAAGWAATPNVGLEFEYAYRNADFDGTARVGGVKGDVDGTAKANSLMVNAVYTLNGMGANAAVAPYLGAGIGAVQLDYDGDKSTWDFGYQVMAGVGYQVAPQWSLYGEGRWFATRDAKVWPAKGLATDLSFGTFDLLVGAKYQF